MHGKRAVTIAVTTAALALAGMFAPADQALAKPQYAVCDDTKSYAIASTSLNHLVQTIPTVQLYNRASTVATLTTNLTITGSVSTSLSVSAGADVNVIVTSVKTTVTASATLTLSGAWATSASMSVRPGQIGYIQGGIFRVQTAGTYRHIDYRCRATVISETAYTPYRYGYITYGG